MVTTAFILRKSKSDDNYIPIKMDFNDNSFSNYQKTAVHASTSGRNKMRNVPFKMTAI